MPNVTATVGGWKATVQLENEDGLWVEAFDVIHDRIHAERGRLSIQETSGEITEDEFLAKIAVLDQLVIATRASLVSTLPAIEWEEV